jgi:MFS family permease
MIGKLTAAALMSISLGISDPIAVGFLFLVVKFFSDWEQPAEWGTISDVGGRGAATLFGCVNTVGALGGILGGTLVGYVLLHFSIDGRPTRLGWEIVFVLTAVEYVAAACCWPFINPERPLVPLGTEQPPTP